MIAQQRKSARKRIQPEELPNDFDGLIKAISYTSLSETRIDDDIKESQTKEQTDRLIAWQASARRAQRYYINLREVAVAKLKALHGVDSQAQAVNFAQTYRDATKLAKKKGRYLDGRSQAGLSAAKKFVSEHAPELMEGLYRAISDAQEQYEIDHDTLSKPAPDTLGLAIEGAAEQERCDVETAAQPDF